ncbi:MAG TPA: nitroreductase family protein [Sedimentisphaerales bacterium]|nr:nitroreductase family protein [Sedimentisphaerales bacterium]
MSFLNLVGRRYSVRNYRSDPVPREKVERCIEAARLAPSACNSQPWKFIVADDPAIKDRLAKAAFTGLVNINHFAYQAPVLVVIVSQRQKLSAKLGGLIKDRDFSLMDIGIAAEHFCLQATEEGLGACMMGWFDEKAVKKLLSIPSAKRIELIISLGLPADAAPLARKRKTADDILSWNKW